MITNTDGSWLTISNARAVPLRPAIMLGGAQIYSDVVYTHPGLILIAMKAAAGDKEAIVIARAITLRIQGVADELWLDYERDILQ